MAQVYIDNERVFDGSLARLGGGGTKTAYYLNGTDFVVLLPNEVDGLQLEKIFPRICHEEETMYTYLGTNGLALSLPVKTCVVTLENGKTLFGLYAPCFESYVNRGAYVLDTKDIRLCCWDRKLRINPTFFDAESWVPIFAPLVQDLSRLAAAGIVPAGDCLNFIITTPAFGKDHVDPLVPFQVRYFGFDFTSKRYVSERAEAINSLEPGTLLKPVQGDSHLENAVDLAVHEVLNLTREREPDEDQEFFGAFDSLCTSVKQKVLESNRVLSDCQ